VPAATTHEPHVRFKPSKVEGFPGAEEIEVYPDRLRVLSEGRWQEFPFADIAVRKEPAWASRLKRRLGGRPFRPHVGELFYVRQPYADSYIRFFTTPRLTVYMPADGPAEYPHSHFWRVQEVIRRGGYAVDDVDPDRERRERELARRPRWLRAAGKALFFAAMFNMVAWLAGVIYLGGMATRSEGGKYYVGTKGKREWEVPRHVWNYSRVHARVTWVLVPLSMVGYFFAHGSLEVMTRREQNERAHRSAAYGPPR
jgi:hypothetical protein